MSEAQVIEADLTWTGRELEPGIRVSVAADGRIDAVGRLAVPPTRRIEGGILLPGFVNGHSHAFQRGLRGKGETFPAGTGSFWTWRTAMYDLVESMTPERAEEISLAAFDEMLDEGITTVGEFHYLHHGTPDARDWALDAAVRRAARTAGIRLVIIQTCYLDGGIGTPLEGGQRRFDGGSPAGFLDRIDALIADLDPEREHAAIAAHSIRAVDPDVFGQLLEAARARSIPLHVHLEEQPAEIDACRARYGTAPVRTLLERAELGADVTAVHLTHTTPEDLADFAATGAGACICPTTEANLGDGIPDLTAMLEGNGRISLGTDSNARISMLEEMRWLEYGQRLRTIERGALIDPAGEMLPCLMRAATEEGAVSLGLDAGEIAVGRRADFAVLDGTHPTLRTWDDGCPLTAAICGAGAGAIAAVCVGGRWRTPRRVTSR